MLLYYLRRNDEASCHTFRRRLSPSTNSAAYLRLVPSTCHGPLQLSILHLHLTARDGAKPDIGSESRFLHTPHAYNAPLGAGFRQNIAMTFNTEKLEWWGYPKVKQD